MTFESLSKEAKPLDFQVSGTKTNVQMVQGSLDEMVQSVHMCGDELNLEEFKCLDNGMQNNGGLFQEVSSDWSGQSLNTSRI